jgi:hypothetical protein
MQALKKEKELYFSFIIHEKKNTKEIITVKELVYLIQNPAFKFIFLIKHHSCF